MSDDDKIIGRRVTVPEFEIVLSPIIKIIDIKTRRFGRKSVIILIDEDDDNEDKNT